MAVTSIWAVKGWLGKLVLYVENPEKTENPEMVKLPEISGMTEQDTQGLSDVIAYAVNAEKTGGQAAAGLPDEDGSPMEQYVSGINCTPATARSEMAAVKKRFGKDGGIVAFHGYQSFAPGECTPAMAHEIGVKLAEELWGSRFQVLVATHLDKAHHLHNHFVVNSVSFADGLRYHRTGKDYRKMRQASDRLCRDYGLSVVEKPERKGKHYGEWRAEAEGRPTYRSLVKADVDEAILKSRTEKQFYHYLKEKGYSFKMGKDITLCQSGRERGLKLFRNFGEAYSAEAIRRRILTENAPFREPEVTGRKKESRTVRVYGDRKHARKIGGLRGLYLRYCYELGILPKNRPPIPPGPLHILLREDLRKLDTISKETRLLCRYHIDTAEALFSFREDLKERMEQLTDERKHLRYKSRSIKDEGKLSEVKAEISGLSEQIRELRKEVVLCDGIAARSGVTREKLKTVRQETEQGKEDKSHEHIRRGR